MEVTKRNFQDVLPKVLEAIDKCDFVAIDSEFSGLRTNACALNELDTLEERYSKLRISAQKFSMIQFGLSAFRYIPSKKKYGHTTYCFYLLAKPGAEEIGDTSSLNFLANNGFDFNKLYKDGIPYMSMKEEDEMRLKMQETTVESPKPSPVKVSEIAAKTFLKETEGKIAAFIEDEESEELVLDGKSLTGFFRKIIYNNIAPNHDNILINTVQNDSGVRNMVLKKFKSSAERLQYIEEEKKRNFDVKVGFTHVVRKLLESDKPIVGHNLVLDLFHLFEKTVMPLPEQLDTFKKLLSCNFPSIYDTKLLAKDPPFSEDIPITGLEILYGTLCEKFKPPEFEVEAGQQSYEISSDAKAHDAGYDAFMTGVCFTTMVKKLDGPTWAKASVVSSKHLKKYANLINNMASYDIPYMNLRGPDVQPDRSKIFAVECIESWRSSDVFALFSMIKSIKLVWVNSKSLYVIPTEDVDMKTLRKHLMAIHTLCPPLVHVRLYNDNHASKRKSESEINTEDNGTNPKEYKRLKSVGSSQMSKMTLESPSTEEAPVITDDAGSEAKESTDGVFQIPNDW